MSPQVKITIGLFISIVFADLAYMYWDVLKYKYNFIDPFYKLDALAWVFFMTIFLYASNKFIKYRPLKYVSMWGLFCTINNILDETLYQNINLTNAEICVFYLITTILVIFYLRCKILSIFKKIIKKCQTKK